MATFAGIANWFVENGTVLIRTREGDHPSVRSLKAQSSNLLERIPDGDMAKSKANSSN
jgi:hypothetical protein